MNGHHICHRPNVFQNFDVKICVVIIINILTVLIYSNNQQIFVTLQKFIKNKKGQIKTLINIF
jgi:hypothetical protein